MQNVQDLEYRTLVLSTILLCIALLSNPASLVAVQANSHVASLTGNELPILLAEIERRTDNRGLSHLLKTATLKSELFRRSLIADSRLKAMTIAVAGISFRDGDQIKNLLSDNEYDLTRFKLSHMQIAKQIEGSANLNKVDQLYDEFKGKWYGLWDRQPVDHHWTAYKPLPLALQVPVNNRQGVELLGFPVCVGG